MSNINENSISAKYARFVLKFRWAIVVSLIAATVWFAMQLQYLDVRNDPDTLLPPTNRYVATNLYAEHNFGMGNINVVTIRVKDGDIYQPWFINMVKEVHDKFNSMTNARPNNFIDLAAQKIKYMGADENGLVFKRLIPVDGISDDPVKAKEELAFLKEGIKNNPILAPMLVSMIDAEGNQCAFADYDKEKCVATSAYIIGDYDDGVKEVYVDWVREARAIAAEYQKDDRIEFLIAGEPYFLAGMLVDLIDSWWLFLISIAIVIAVLWYEFKNWRGALYPLIGVFMTITFTLGLMGFTAFKLTTMMVLTPMLLLAIGIGHSVQVTRRFLQEHQESGDPEKAAYIAIAATIVPATLSIITDMVGFATLATVDISFYKAYAYFGMFGMLTLLFTTTTLIPIFMSKFPPPVSNDGHDGHAWEENVGGFITRLISGPGKWVPILGITAVMAWSWHYTEIGRGIDAMMAGEEGRGDPEVARIQDEFDIMPGVEKGINYPRAAFKGSSETIKMLDRLNEIMPGVISVNIPIRGKQPIRPECEDEDDDGNLIPKGCWDPDNEHAQGIFNDAAVMADIEALEIWMQNHDLIGFTGSYIQFVRMANMLLAAEPGTQPKLRDLAIPTKEYLEAIDPEDDRDPGGMVRLYNGLLELMVSDGDLDSFVRISDWNEGVVLGFINTMDPKETHQVTVDIINYLEEHKNDPGFKKVNFGLRAGPVDDLSSDTNELSIEGSDSYTKPAVGGFLGATEATREVAMENWLVGPLQTALAIFIITALMFRSFLVASILTFTLFITLFAQYGLGGYFTSIENWSGNLAFHLLVTLSIAMGLGVDYGIYMFMRLREEMVATGNNWMEALKNTQNTTGSAVIISIVVLLGSFIPLVSTDLGNTWGLSMYIGQALIIDVFTALMILPLLVKWLKPKFVFQN